jgi:hypothetical protein
MRRRNSKMWTAIFKTSVHWLLSADLVATVAGGMGTTALSEYFASDLRPLVIGNSSAVARWQTGFDPPYADTKRWPARGVARFCVG